MEPTSIVQWFAAMVSYMEADTLERYLVHILTPVYQLINDDTVRDAAIGEHTLKDGIHTDASIR